MTINELVNQINADKIALNNAISIKDEKQITVCRGRLIRDLNKLLSKKYVGYQSAQNKAAIMLRRELKEHKTQLNNRLNAEKKKDKDYSITNEIAFKIRKTATSIKQIKIAATDDEKKAAIKETASNTLGTLFSTSKIVLKPTLFVGKKVGGIASYLTGRVIGLPFDLINNLFGKIVKPDAKWDLKTSENFGKVFQDFTEKALGKLNDNALRM